MRTLFLFTLLFLSSIASSTPLRDYRHRRPQAALEPGATSNAKPVGVEQRSMDEIYQAALSETGTLRVAWGGDVRASKNGIYKAFTARFPGIKLNITLDLSKYLDGVIDLSYNGTHGQDDGADVAVLQSVHNFPRWKSQGRLLPYKVAPWNDVSPQFVDADGAYTGLHIFTLGFQVYNPKAINNASLPKTHLDFLLPEWKDRLILTYPNDDDAVLYLFKGITDKYGFDYLHKLQQQNVRWVRGTATPAMLITNTNPRHTIDAGTVAQNARSISFASSDTFTPGVAVQTFDDVYMTWPQTGAIFATTKMPESARLFMSFLMDDHWQRIVSEGKFATRRKFDNDKILAQRGRSPLDYVKFMGDRQKVEAWRFQVEKVLGTATGIDPVDVW